jgi:Bacterial Ig-like domain (group 2)
VIQITCPAVGLKVHFSPPQGIPRICFPTNATLSSIAITPANASIALDAPEQFKAQGTFTDSTTRILSEQVAWNSSAINVAIINASGAAGTTGTGSTTVGATLNGVTGTTGLTVTP